MTAVGEVIIAGIALAAWAWMLCLRGGFWLARERDDRDLPDRTPAYWPDVVAVVPARNEADVIGRSIGSLLAQDYPGRFSILLIDDSSEDGTAEAAPAAPGKLEVVRGAPLPPGWTGKLWAMRQGAERAAQTEPRYLLFTDADIAHAPENLRRLVARSEAKDLVLNSLMAELSVTNWAERLLIPAFVFFFAMLYPFAWANDLRRRTAAAAGGCMLVQREALEAAGGVAAIRGQIIDDCALAVLMKRQGPIWLGLTHCARSLRPYPSLGAIGAMVCRSAYAQLRFSPWLLAGTVIGMALVYLAGPLLAVFGSGLPQLLGALSWAAMALAFQPMLRFYRCSPLWGLCLPLIGALYSAFTLASAVQTWRGRGGTWKGRAQAQAAVS